MVSKRVVSHQGGLSSGWSSIRGSTVTKLQASDKGGNSLQGTVHVLFEELVGDVPLVTSLETKHLRTEDEEEAPVKLLLLPV